MLPKPEFFLSRIVNLSAFKSKFLKIKAVLMIPKLSNRTHTVMAYHTIWREKILAKSSHQKLAVTDYSHLDLT